MSLDVPSTVRVTRDTAKRVVKAFLRQQGKQINIGYAIIIRLELVEMGNRAFHWEISS